MRTFRPPRSILTSIANDCAGSTISSTRGPERLLAAAWACSALLAAAARADLVVLSDGGVIEIVGHEVRGDDVYLDLAAGGRVKLSIERIDRVIPDEVLAREPEAAPPEAPPGFSVRFHQGHPQPDTPYGGPIWEAANRHGLNPALLAAVAQVESRFDPRAVSHRGARGLLQVMPATARRLGFQAPDLFDPETNLDAGARYLRQLADRFGNDLALVLAAYNAGEAAVERWGGVPPYRETLGYLARIYALLGLSSPDGT